MMFARPIWRANIEGVDFSPVLGKSTGVRRSVEHKAAPY